MNKLTFLSLAALQQAPLTALPAAESLIYEDSNRPLEGRVNDLLKQPPFHTLPTPP